MQCFPEEEEGENTSAEVNNTEALNHKVISCCEVLHSILFILPLKVKSSLATFKPDRILDIRRDTCTKTTSHSQIISHLLGYYKNTGRNKCVLSWSLPLLSLERPCLCVILSAPSCDLAGKGGNVLHMNIGHRLFRLIIFPCELEL